MALFNYATKEITLKIVYYGPGLSGKTTNLQHLHSILNPEKKGKLLSLSTESERTLFFDFLPVELGKIREFSIRFQLYTVPGQVRYNATRKVVLKGADAVVFVADSQCDMREQNIESLENMRENLVSNNINPDAIPIMLQYNKRDLKNILDAELLNKDLNQNGNHEVIEAVAIDGRGVEETFRRITRLLLKDISRKHRIEIPLPEETGPVPMPSPPAVSVAQEPVKEEVTAEKTGMPKSETVKMTGFEASLLLKDISRQYKTEFPFSEGARPASPSGEPSLTKPQEAVREEVKAQKADPSVHDAVKTTEFQTPPLRGDAPQQIPITPPPDEVGPASAPAETVRSLPQESVSIDQIMDKIHNLMSDAEKVSDVGTSVPELSAAETEQVSYLEERLANIDKRTTQDEPASIDIHEEMSSAALGTAEDIRSAETEEIIKWTGASFTETPAAETPSGVECAPAEPRPPTGWAEVSEIIRELSERMYNTSEAIAVFQQTVSDLKTEVKALRSEMALTALQAKQGSEIKDVQELKELKREQKKVSELVADIVDLLHSLKEKRSWFRW